MRLAVLAAALLLIACNDGGSGPSLPEVQPGAQAPSRQTRIDAPQADLSEDERAELRLLVESDVAQRRQLWAAGFTPLPKYEVAALQPGTDHRWRVELAGGASYRIIGGCDNECGNLDMELIDMSTGGVVASDMLGDDFPIVDFTPAADGGYLVRLLLQTCSVAPCYVGAQLLVFETQKPSTQVSLPPADTSVSQHFPGSPDLRRPDPMLHEMQLRPILSHLDELYGRDFSTYLDTAFELRSGESFEGRVTVESGKARAYIGGCSGCSNIDIELLDANARIVAGDNLPDNHPVLYFLPQASGAYTLRVTMRECSAAACVAGVRTMWTDNVLTK